MKYSCELCYPLLVAEANASFKFVDAKDYVVCKICELKAQEIPNHLKRNHNITSAEYKQTYKSPVKSERNSDRYRGKNNPGYQHGGRLSSWSENSEYHDVSLAKENQQKALEKSHANPNSCFSNTKLETYVNAGYSLEDAEEALKNRQTTFSLAICIDKYGEEEGTKRWNARQELWQGTLNSKSDEEKSRINAAKVWKNGISSSIEIEFANLLLNFIEIETQFPISYDNTRWFLYDVKYKNKIIEFNGDFWHANPNIYSSDTYKGIRGSTMNDVIDKDKKKIAIANEHGYDVKVIWESDFKKDKQQVIKECINFLTQ